MDSPYMHNVPQIGRRSSLQLYHLPAFPSPQVQQRVGDPTRNRSSLPSQHASSTLEQSAYDTSPVAQLSHDMSNPSHTLFSSPSSSTYPNPARQPSLGDVHGQAGYFPSGGTFSSSGSMMPPASTASSHSQSVASTAAQARAPVPLRPMPSGGLPNYMPPVSPTPYDHAGLQSQAAHPGDLDVQPTHVVGSQGRRGILPSAPGRAAANTDGAANGKNATIPPKDADGKFPCPHCNKTYLHAKHLKRHLLRHTGDRPYMCVLCRDTFSRSDILKRHFQKCSLRRGNPTGASHLSHSQAHVKKSHPGSHKSSTAGLDESEYIGSFDGADGLAEGIASYDLDGTTDGTAYTDESNPVSMSVSRRESLKRPSSGGGRDRRSLTGPGPSGSNRASIDGGQPDGTGLALSAGLEQLASPISMLPARNPQQMQFPIHYGFDAQSSNSTMHQDGHLSDSSSLSQSHNDLNYFNGVQNQHEPGGKVDWTQLYQAGSQDGMNNALFGSHARPGQLDLGRATEAKTGPFVSRASVDGIFPGLYPSSNTGLDDGSFNMVDGFPNWHIDMTLTDPLQNRADGLVRFCVPDTASPSLEDQEIKAELRRCLTVENIKCFLELFTNFQGHWPMIHMSTFNFQEVYEGLLLAIICIGAVYSDGLSGAQVRTIMVQSQKAIERTSPMYALVKGDPTGGQQGRFEYLGRPPPEIEQIQALTLLQILFTWHGDQVQREPARRTFADLVKVARKADLLKPVGPDHYAYSLLHQPELGAEHFVSGDFDWAAWIEQEKRVRVMYNIYLLDTALVIYFNKTPLFDEMEMQIPLPTDDSAWDAQTACDCADALGLHGAAAQASNVAGTRRLKQPEMHAALETLLHPTLDLRPCSTNAYSKFILIHAVHVQIWKVQKQLWRSGGRTPDGDASFTSTGSGTDLSRHDWVVKITEEGADGQLKGGLPQRPMPLEVNGAPQGSGAHQALKGITNALGKWKKAWDEDMKTQYPPSVSPSRRLGFGRDGLPFYWLARAFLRNTRAMNWQAPADSRLVQVLSLLKKLKQWVATDGAQRGEEMGAVGDIDDSYGVDELTLDMKLLFRPINERLGSPVLRV